MRFCTPLRTYRGTLAALAFLAIVAGSSACDKSATGTTEVVAPSHSVLTGSRSVVPVQSLVTYQKSVTQSSASAIIGPNGGKLSVGKHSISVPRKAVDENVLFSMTVVAGDTVQVALRATRTSNGEPYGFFGSAVTLKLSYADANVADPSQLLVTFLVEGTTSGIKEGLPSDVRMKAKTVSAPLIHFSNYALGEN